MGPAGVLQSKTRSVGSKADDCLAEIPPSPCWTGSANVVDRPFIELFCISVFCQMLALVVNLNEYTVLFALTIKQAYFEQINRYIYLFSKRVNHPDFALC